MEKEEHPPKVKIYLYLHPDKLYEDLLLSVPTTSGSGDKKIEDHVIYKSETEVEVIKKHAPTIGKGDLEIRTSSIQNIGIGVFAKRSFEVGEIVSYYNGPLYTEDKMYQIMLQDKTYSEPYESHARAFIRGVYVQIGNRTSFDVPIKDPSVELIDDGIGGYINDAHGTHYEYNVEFKNIDSPSNNEIYMKKLVKEGINMEPLVFYGMKETPIIGRFVNPLINPRKRLICVVATKPIDAGEELFVYYGSNYFDKYPSATVDSSSPTFNTSNDGGSIKWAIEGKYNENRSKLPPQFKPVASLTSVEGGCFFCGRTNQIVMMRCSACKKARYCDKQCQKLHWPVHKHVCFKK